MDSLDSDDDFLMSEFTKDDMHIMECIADVYFASGAHSGGTAVSLRADVDISQAGRVIKSALKQYGGAINKVLGARIKGRTKAIKILRKALKVADAQLSFISRENAQLRKELADVRRELADCGSRKKDDDDMTDEAQMVAIQSAMDQVAQVEKESEQINRLVDSTRNEIAEGVREASSAVVEGEKEAVDDLNEAIDDTKDLQEIQTRMEESGDIPPVLSAVPKAPTPGANAFTAPQDWATDNGDKITASPVQVAGADEVAEALQEDKNDLFSQMKAAVEARRIRLNIDEDDAESQIRQVNEKIHQMQVDAGYHQPAPVKRATVPRIQRARDTSLASPSKVKATTQAKKKAAPTRDRTKASPARTKASSQTTVKRSPVARNTVAKKTAPRLKPAAARRKKPMMRGQPAGRKPMFSSSSLMSGLGDTEETRDEDSSSSTYEVPDALSVRSSKAREQLVASGVREEPGALDFSSEDEDDDDMFF
jgi:hypothetical protein